MVMAPARTGSDSRISHEVTKIDQLNSGTLNRVMPGARMFRKVVIMLMAPGSTRHPKRVPRRSPDPSRSRPHWSTTEDTEPSPRLNRPDRCHQVPEPKRRPARCLRHRARRTGCSSAGMPCPVHRSAAA